jgi:hypothetical protein
MRGELCCGPRAPTFTAMRAIETIDSELRLVAALRRAARERGGPLPSVGVADALLDERAKVKADHGGGRSAPLQSVRRKVGTVRSLVLESRVVIGVLPPPRHLDRLVAGMRGFMQGCKVLYPQLGGT